MASAAPTLVPFRRHTLSVDPPGECPTCASAVPEVASDILARAVPGERHGDVVDVLVSTVGLTVTAQPCGHVIHQWRKDADA
jgi:hypothetical protein